MRNTRKMEVAVGLVFPEWQTAPVEPLVRVKATGREIEEFAKKLNTVIR